jgi:T-complex protein 1 subunit theta
MTQSTLSSALKPAIASKQYGFEDQLASLVAEAALAIMPANPKNFNVDNVRVVKIMGGSLSGSKVVQGMVFGREPEGENKLSGRYLALLTILLQVTSIRLRGQRWLCTHPLWMPHRQKRKALC